MDNISNTACENCQRQLLRLGYWTTGQWQALDAVAGKVFMKVDRLGSFVLMFKVT